MKAKQVVLISAAFCVFCSCAAAQQVLAARLKTDVFEVRVEQQYKTVRPEGQSALAVHFKLKKDWHFYASAKTAPGQMNLKIEPSARGSIEFSEVILPKWHMYFDKVSEQKLEVFSGDFTVYVPFSVASDASGKVPIEIKLAGAICSDELCRAFEEKLATEVTIDSAADMGEPAFRLPEVDTAAPQRVVRPAGQWADVSAFAALGLAFVAGLVLNLMPCVWPVLPLIVMRLVQQAKHSRGKSIALGLAFCFGILLFFAALAGANIILQLFYGTVLQWGDQFRNPAFVAGMAVLLVVLALFMFDIFTITIRSAVSSKVSTRTGYTGAVGMGFLAAVLSTPCSFAILAAAFAWAQAQPLPLATIAMLVIGAGMAAPYAVLTAIPGLLQRTPKPGRWMELFKQTIGFVLLIIALKLIAAIPQDRRMDVLYFSVVLSFCIWMWASWVSFNTKLSRKLMTRAVAVILAISAGWAFLRPPAAELINWQKYDAASIDKALAQDRPVLIKFTADWCLSCQMVEKTVYGREDIAELIKLENVLAIKADTTIRDYPATLALKNVYNEPGVPVSMLFVPGNAEPARWRGLAFADDLKKRLQQLAGQQ